MHLDQVTIFSLLFGLTFGGLGFYEKWRLDRIERLLRKNLEAYKAQADLQSGKTL